MSTVTAQLLDEFEKLPLAAQREFSDATLHRTAHFDCDAPSDEELTAAAREVFVLLDREEEAMPRGGEVWMVDLGMAQKTRPALILSIAYQTRFHDR